MFNYYLKMAMKAFLRFKLHTLINVASLMFGFICVIAAFICSDYLNSFDKHFPNSDRIFTMQKFIDLEGGSNPVGIPVTSRPLADHLKINFPELELVVRGTIPQTYDVSTGGRIDTYNIRFVEPEFLNLFPIPIFKGIPTGTPLQPNTALISYDAAIKRFGTTDVIGKRLLIANQEEVTIAGVTDKFTHPSHIESAIPQFSSDLIAPLEIHDRINNTAQESESDAESWGHHSYTTYVRLPPSNVLGAGEFEKRLERFVEEVVPKRITGDVTIYYSINPISEYIPSIMDGISGSISLTNILIFAGTLVLLIACLNTSNIIIAQLVQRRHEIGIQKIMGARRRQLLYQFSLESLLLCTISFSSALLFYSIVIIGVKNAGDIDIQFSLLYSPDLWKTLIFVIATIVLISGTYPALRVSRTALVGMLNSQGTGVNYSQWLRSLMVGAQFTISSTLIILVFILIKQNQFMLSHASNSFDDPKLVYAEFTKASNIDETLLASELIKHPGVISTTRSLFLPWRLSNLNDPFTRELGDYGPRDSMNIDFVSYDYFTTLEIPLIAGRTFSREFASDVFPDNNKLGQLNGPFSVIINEEALQALGFNSATEAIGQTIYRHMEPPAVLSDMTVPMTIIGVVENKALRIMVMGTKSNVYIMQPAVVEHLIVRVDKKNVALTLEHLDRIWDSFLPDINLRPQFIDDLFMQSNKVFVFIGRGITILAVLAFLISCIGLLGTATFIVNRRQREVGIRKVMGASSWRVLCMLLIDFSRPVLIANIIAWPLAYVISQGYLSIFSYRSPVTIFPFILSLVIAVVIAWLAVGNQAFRSSRARPARVLRYE